jgi:hypothetical protein
LWKSFPQLKKRIEKALKTTRKPHVLTQGKSDVALDVNILIDEVVNRTPRINDITGDTHSRRKTRKNSLFYFI